MAALLEVLREQYRPTTVVARSGGLDDVAVGEIPLLEGRTMREGAATAYVCRRFSCQAPVTTAAQLREQLAAVETAGQPRPLASCKVRRRLSALNGVIRVGASPRGRPLPSPSDYSVRRATCPLFVEVSDGTGHTECIQGDVHARRVVLIDP